MVGENIRETVRDIIGYFILWLIAADREKL